MTSPQDLFVRNRVLRGVVMLALLVLVGHLFGMMVVRHGYYKDQALENRQVRFRVRAPRGLVLDRHGTPVADNMFVADITLPSASLGEAGPDSTLQRLLTWFDLPRDATLARLRQQQENRRRGRLVLVAGASLSQITAVEERGRQLPGVRVKSRSRRRYPFGPLLVHVTGYVGEVSQAQLDTATGYRIGDMVGKQGVEAALEKELRGRAGVKLEEVNAAGRIVGREAIWLREALPGRDVTLTISLPLQSSLAAALGERPACAVVVDVRTGEVLAACSQPGFDPDELTGGMSSEKWNRLANDPAKPFFNRIVQATYAPGSIYKPVTSLAGFSAGVIDTDTWLEPCLGGWQFGNRFFRCWKRSGHGPVDHLMAMTQSCDTYYYQLALRLDIDILAEAARALGLGRTCTDIFPEEVPGNVPDTAWYDKRFGRRGWTQGVMLNNVIGQGELLVTPLQMAMLAARLATDGRVPEPVFVRDPAPLRRTAPPLPFEPAHLAWIRMALTETVATGTGRSAALDSVAVAGKTGTTENPHGEDHAWFMCWAPAQNPEVALAVIIENAGHGGTEAAPVARLWLADYFRLRDELGLGGTP